MKSQPDPQLKIPETEIHESFIRASGPGGQNVNKVATAVQLRFDAMKSGSLSAEVRHRLMSIAGHQLTREGIIVITARRHRTQERNRQDARERLAEMVREASIRPKSRIRTRPSASSKRKRLEGKKIQSKRKRLRHSPADDS